MSAPSWYKPQPHSPYQVYKPEVIRDIQRTLSCPETGELDQTTVSHIKGLQYAMGVPGTGRIDARTAEGIETLRARYNTQPLEDA